jgi:hypothetical protein
MAAFVTQPATTARSARKPRFAWGTCQRDTLARRSNHQWMMTIGDSDRQDDATIRPSLEKLHHATALSRLTTDLSLQQRLT